MNETLKNVLNNTIANQYLHSTDDFLKNLEKNKSLKIEHEIYSLKAEAIRQKINEILPEEYKDLLEELQNSIYSVSSIESEVYFKEGLILGVTELNYLNEVGLGIAFI